MKHEIDLATECGRRSQNEDTILADGSVGLFAVADGIGGEPGGALASQVAVDTLHGFFERCAPPASRDAEVALDQMDLAIRLAQRRVTDAAHGPYARMGTTLAALLVCGSRAVIAHVGDSRVYRVRGGSLERLTQDHCVREQLKVQPELSGAILDTLVRAISPRCDARPDLTITEIAENDTLLLCTDGVYKPIGDANLARLLDGPWTNPARVIVSGALAAGGRDNASAVVLRAR